MLLTLSSHRPLGQIQNCNITQLVKSLEHKYGFLGKSEGLDGTWVLELTRMSSGTSPPDVGNLSRLFEGAMGFLVKGGISIF